MKTKLYRLKTVTKKIGIDEKTIIRYEKEGLLSPVVKKEEKFYSADDLEKISMIKRLTDELGVNLAGVEVILNMRQQMVTMQEEFEKIIADMKKGIFRELQEFESRARRPQIESRSKKAIKVKIED